ncbi:MAG: RDD family protein [Propionibacteriaceae bacterium]|nr:RDD family protein [Propionibacteriaceae bacterium]
MTQPQPGWYPDPADAERQRYWAGDAWTAETRTATTPTAAPASAASSDPYARYAQGATGIPVYKGPATPATAPAVASGPTTADGVPLAGWWWRVLAAVLDYVLLGVIAIFYLPLIPNLYSGMTAFVQDVMNATVSGAALPSFTDPIYHLQTALLTMGAVELGVACVYVAVMLGFAGATLGQMACGLRVVPVDHGTAPRRLPPFPIAMRLVFYTALPTALGFAAYTNLAIASMLSYVGLTYQIFNYLWAVWDPKRQCIHDKLARTQVVRPGR